jgi:hypothetical protein
VANNSDTAHRVWGRVFAQPGWPGKLGQVFGGEVLGLIELPEMSVTSNIDGTI